MAKTKRLFKSFSRLLLPVIVLFVLAVAGASIWLVHSMANPPRSAYLVTPERYGQLSTRGARVTDENWTSRDGTGSRGWLLRGSENAPAVILLHRYGVDRSHMLDLGVKLNEATNFTVLMPDERGHGTNPTVKFTSFGGCETEDISGALEFLRGLKTEAQTPLIGQSIGIYGVEMGALVAMSVAAKDEYVRALILDSVPLDSDGVLTSAVGSRFPFASAVTSKFARLGTYAYFYNGCYKHDPVCETAKAVSKRQVLLLAGSDAAQFQDSTGALAKCFPSTTKIESKLDLNPSGYGITSASLEQSEAYDRRVIEFFKMALGNAQ
jgi:pimeloyl-ACP methyl ester carboxylesterase